MDQVSDTRNTDEAWMEHIALKEAFKSLGDREKQILRLRFRCWIRWTHWQSTNAREKFVISACRTKLHLA